MADDAVLDDLVTDKGAGDAVVSNDDAAAAGANSAAAGAADTKPAAPTGDDTKPDAKAVANPANADGKATPVADWPADWREKAAGGDAKILQRLSRYASPKALTEALIAAQNRIREGELAPRIKKDSGADEIKAYREAHGIPETVEGYDLKKYNITDADKPLVEGYLKRAHETHQTPEQVAAGLDAYYEISQKMADDRHQQDAQVTQEAEDSLRTEWGDDFRRNINLIKSFLDGAPEGLKDRLLKGRLSDGRPIASDPSTLRWLLSLELDRNPVGIIAPASGENMRQSVDDEIKKIEDAMRKDRAAYNKDEKMQQRYRDLLEYRIQQNEKGKKAA